jgi:hypothetical protein
MESRTVAPAWRHWRCVSGCLLDRILCGDDEEAPWWRWRESNPRPQTTIQDFSGRSWLVVLLGPYALTSTS